ncbi:MAG: serine protease [Elusimicrobiota bacterium]|nr:serine protease [Elusimicrobiota bacterium]
MDKFKLPLFVFLVLTFFMTNSAFAANKIIFGVDDREDYYEMPNNLKALANSTVSLWHTSRLQFEKETNSYRIFTSTFGNDYNLCPGVKFREQQRGASCSGALVGENLILTAGHCVQDERRCKNTAFIFDYIVKSPKAGHITNIPAENVYFCSKLMTQENQHTTVTNNGQSVTTHGPDLAIIKLARKVKDRKPIGINRKDNIKKGAPVFTMGHPKGLPLKLSQNARVVKEVTKELAYFKTNLDGFHGNSGGAVFNTETLLIEGILVRGDSGDFLQTFDGCYIYKVRPENAGYGADVTKINLLTDFIPLTPEEQASEEKIETDTANLQKLDFTETLRQTNFDF